MKFAYLSLLALLCLSIKIPASAQTLQDEISAYNQGNYAQVINIARQLAAEKNHNPTFHYYLANAYTRLGLNEDAIKEYSICQSLTDDLTLKTYCEEALRFLINNHTNPPVKTFSPPSQQSLPYTAQNVSARQNYENQLSELREKFRLEQESVPKYSYDESGRRTPNPNYQIAMQELIAKERDEIASWRMTFQENKQLSSTSNAANSYIPAKYNNLPGYQKPAPYQKPDYTDILFNTAPLAPPPFPASALKGAQQALHRKIN